MKKQISIIIVVALLMQLFSTVVFANSNIQFSAEIKNSEDGFMAGDTAEVQIWIKNNSGFATALFSVTYNEDIFKIDDSCFTYDEEAESYLLKNEYYNEKLLDENFMCYGSCDENGGLINFNLYGNTAVSGDCVLVTVPLTISDSAQAGRYPISISGISLEDVDFNEVDAEGIDGYITINEPPHEHAPLAGWQYDEDNHWQICECREEIANSRAAHHDDDMDDFCDDCGYNVHVCVFDQEDALMDALKSEADCNNAAVYYKSCLCGAISTTETFIYGSANGHTETDWQKSNDEHWRVCGVCTEEIANSRGTHADNDGDYACDTCGYDMTPAQPEHPVCVFDQEVVKAEALKSAADCENAAVYYKSCTCGAISTTETFTYGSANGHTESDWQKSTTDHWKYCTVCNEEIVNSRSGHADNDSNNTCDSCGYDMTPAQPEHPVCVFDQEVVKAETLKSEADCDNAAVYYKSCTCGAISNTETFTYGSANGHTESDWQKSATDHWKVCSVCTEEIVNSRGIHADADGDNTCDTCGYDMTPAQPDDPEHTVHVYDREVIKAEALKSAADCDDPAVYYMSCECGEVGTVETFTYGTPNGHTPSGWQNDDDEHWKYCLICSDLIVGTKGSHADNADDNRCDVCGYRMGGNGQHYWPSYNFPVLPTMPVQMPFTDVYRADWFYDDVYNAWKNDLIDGVTSSEFRPYETLTVAQAIKLAAALHQLDNMGYVTLSNGYTNWYDTYVDYAVENGIIENKYASYTAAQMNAPISRNEFVHIFYGAMSYYSQWNSVDDNAIPDVKLGDKYASEIYTFYRAGILTGNDAAGTFAPNSSIKRSEVAAILSRMYDESCRQSITLN